MLGWFAGRYFIREAKRLNADIRTLNLNDRRSAVLLLVSKMKEVGGESGDPNALAVREILAEAMRARQMSVANGASTFKDPQWCSWSLVETWAGARLAAITKRISKTSHDQVGKILYGLMSDTLSPEGLVEALSYGDIRIFINYRREDAAGQAANLRRALSAEFGASNVFMDADTLTAGSNFEATINSAISNCNVFLCLMADQWVRLLQARSKLSDMDFVRHEISLALQCEVLVMPIRFGSSGRMSPLPTVDELPTDVKELVSLSFYDVRHEYFERDVSDLIAQIRSSFRKSAHYSVNRETVDPRAIATLESVTQGCDFAHPSRFIDLLDAKYILRPTTASLAILLGRDDRNKWSPIQYEELIESVAMLAEKKMIEPILALSKDDVVITALLSGALWEHAIRQRRETYNKRNLGHEVSLSVKSLIGFLNQAL